MGKMVFNQTIGEDVPIEMAIDDPRIHFHGKTNLKIYSESEKRELENPQYPDIRGSVFIPKGMMDFAVAYGVPETRGGIEGYSFAISYWVTDESKRNNNNQDFTGVLRYSFKSLDPDVAEIYKEKEIYNESDRHLSSKK